MSKFNFSAPWLEVGEASFCAYTSMLIQAGIYTRARSWSTHLFHKDVGATIHTHTPIPKSYADPLLTARDISTGCQENRSEMRKGGFVGLRQPETSHTNPYRLRNTGSSSPKEVCENSC